MVRCPRKAPLLGRFRSVLGRTPPKRKGGRAGLTCRNLDCEALQASSRCPVFPRACGPFGRWFDSRRRQRQARGRRFRNHRCMSEAPRLSVLSKPASGQGALVPWSSRLRLWPPRSEPKLPATLSHLKQIPVRILEPRGGTPGNSRIGWIEGHSARLQRLERHPDIFHLDGINRGTQLGPGGCAWPQNELEVLTLDADGQESRSVGVGKSPRLSRPMTFV